MCRINRDEFPSILIIMFLNTYLRPIKSLIGAHFKNDWKAYPYVAINFSVDYVM